MAGKLSTFFLTHGLTRFNTKQSNLRFVFDSRRPLPASCKMRRRSFRLQHKEQSAKKGSPEVLQLNAQLAFGDGDAKLGDGSSKEFSIARLNLPAGSPATGDSIPTSVDVDDGETLPSIQLEDLIRMVRNAEKNILLINQARLHALEDLEKIGSEKESLQGEINNLEMRLAETDAKIRVAAQHKIHVELLEKQLEEMRKELSNRNGYQGSNFDTNGMRDEISKDNFHVLFEELISLRAENVSLKGDIEALRTELSSITTTDDCKVMLENKHSHLESAVDDLEVKLAAAQRDVTTLSSLKLEYKSLWEKVEDLQSLLDKATKQADEAASLSQQNQELRKKVERLEEYLQEANALTLSTEKMQKYHELMQQKIKLLEERLQRSDEEIHSYVQLHQESMKGFQDSLNSLMEESKKRALDEPVDDMPWEFWSSLLLLVDGWLLERKITPNNAELLKEMVLKRDRRICDAYLACKEKDELEALSVLLRLTSNSTSSGLHIIHIAAEMAPVAKVGGLGDVVTGLGKALQKKGHLVEIILPKYDCMQYEFIHDLRALNVVLRSYFDKQLYENKIWVGTVEGLPVYFIEPLHPSKFFSRGQYYGEHDDFKRFSFFSRAALELFLQAGKKPDIIHCHDWQTAFVAPLYWEIYAHKGLNSARICFTCHNFEYQGTAPASELASCGLDVDHLNRQDRMQDNVAHDRVNPVKGAVVFSNIVTTVSPTYAQEVLTPEGGRGLHTTLSSQSRKFIGILNGIDADSWNPATDVFLKRRYNSSDIQGKLENKNTLRKHLHLSSADATRPLVCCITRLVPQKGVHLIRHAIYRTLELGGQFVLLGSSPVHYIQREFEGIASHFQSHEDARLILKYDEPLSHLIYAASDMFIIPSIFEPCGLTQMVAMRYGSIPIARKTGGLNDSVFDVDDTAIPEKFQNGFTFVTADEQGVNSALDRAFHHYKYRESWQRLVLKVMEMDFSWNSSALQYEELYRNALIRARAAKRA
ncbi:Probable starch synthase 4, chloroplastic/amyloplastic [Dionaea muscipula]